MKAFLVIICIFGFSFIVYRLLFGGNQQEETRSYSISIVGEIHKNKNGRKSL